MKQEKEKNNKAKEQRRWDLAIKQLELNHKNIERLDGISLRIKGWTIVAWSVFLGFAISDKQYIFSFLSAVPIILFWMLDIQYKFFHEQFLRINMNIEKVLFSEEVSEKDFEKIFVSKNLEKSFWNWKRWNFGKDFWDIFKRFWFHFPYLSMLLISLLNGLILIYSSYDDLFSKIKFLVN